MSEITITKGKVLKDKVEVFFDKIIPNKKKPAKCTYEDDFPAHDDLRKTFEQLNVHSALLGEFIPIVSVGDQLQNADPAIVNLFSVTGFSLSGSDEDEGVILTAHKTLKSGKVLGFNTPLIRFNDQSENAYPFMGELQVAIASCKQELDAYLNGKHAPDNQQELPFERKENNNDSSSDSLEPGETNDALENERIKNGVPGSAQKRKKKKAA